MNCVRLVHERNERRPVANTLINFRFPCMAGNFLVRMATFRFESKILLPGFDWLEFSIKLGNYNLGLRGLVLLSGISKIRERHSSSIFRVLM